MQQRLIELNFSGSRQLMGHKIVRKAMAKLWDYIKQLFQEAEQSSPSKPVVHKMIERTEEEKQDYLQWREGLVRRRLVDWLRDQYAIFQVLPDDIDEALDFLNTPSSKGFVIHFYKTNYSKREVFHLFDYLKEKVLDLNYRTQISDSRTYNKPNWVETTERHYLKPRPNFEAGKKLKQAFGNVMIEVELRDEKVRNLRFRATVYKDHQFEDAEDFKDLMRELLI